MAITATPDPIRATVKELNMAPVSVASGMADTDLVDTVPAVMDMADMDTMARDMAAKVMDPTDIPDIDTVGKGVTSTKIRP